MSFTYFNNISLVLFLKLDFSELSVSILLNLIFGVNIYFTIYIMQDTHMHYEKKLAHTIIEIKKSHNLPFSRWKPQESG